MEERITKNQTKTEEDELHYIYTQYYKYLLIEIKRKSEENRIYIIQPARKRVKITEHKPTAT